MTTPSFTPPPLGLAVENVLDFFLDKNPDYPLFLHTLTNGALRHYTYSEVVPAAQRAGHHISKSISLDTHISAPVVAILATTDVLTYGTILLGLLHAGITSFPISPRFSHTVIAHLLDAVKPTHILVNEDTYRLACDALNEMSPGKPGLIRLPTYAELYPGQPYLECLPAKCQPRDWRPFILHSSSSTSLFPKTIAWTSEFLSHIAKIIDHSAQALTGQVMGCQAMEFFHSAGICFLIWMCRAGVIMATLPPEAPEALVPPELNAIFRSFEDTQASLIWASPRLLETWSEDPEKVEYLTQLRSVVSGGRFLNKSIGDRLANLGVNICMSYGATESGPISTFFCMPQGPDWEYFTLNPVTASVLVPRDCGSYEVIVRSLPGQELPICNTTWDGHPAYATGDLLLPHPVKTNYFKVLGRSSDQIMLATGEVVNPLSLEDAIVQHPHVGSAVLFGHSRNHIGVIIEVSDKFLFGQGCFFTAEDFVNDIWPHIEEKNCEFPKYSQIMRRMIIIASKFKPFPYGPKGLPRRAIIWNDYQTEIDSCYKNSIKD